MLPIFVPKFHRKLSNSHLQVFYDTPNGITSKQLLQIKELVVIFC